MKFLIFSDLHSHNYREFSDETEGINSRLAACLECVEMVKRQATNWKADALLFCGDLFKLKNNHDSIVVYKTVEAIADLSLVAPVIMIPGHHDYRMWSSDPVIMWLLGDFANNVKVVDKPQWIDFGEIKIYAEPCTRKTSEMNERIAAICKTEKSIFMAHQDITGAKYGSYVVEQGLDADLVAERFTVAFIGHYHAPMAFRPNVISVGAPMQHDFGDAGGERGWWQLNTATGSLKHIKNEHSPKFYDVTVQDNKDVQIPGRPDKDYYRIKVVGSLVVSEIVHSIRWKRITFDINPQSTRKAVVSLSDRQEDIVAKYVALKGQGFDADKLCEIGIKYLTQRSA